MSTSTRPPNLSAQAREIFEHMRQRVDPPDTFLRLLGNSLWLFPGLLLIVLMTSQFSGSSILFSAIAYAGFALYVIVTRRRIAQLSAVSSETNDTAGMLITVYYLFFVGLSFFFLSIIIIIGAINAAGGLPGALGKLFQIVALTSIVAVVVMVFAFGPRLYRRLFGYGVKASNQGSSRGVIAGPFAILLVTILRILFPATLPYLSIPFLVGSLLFLVGAAAMLDQAWVLWLAGVRNSRQT